jgi:hypothetical protein
MKAKHLLKKYWYMLIVFGLAAGYVVSTTIAATPTLYDLFELDGNAVWDSDPSPPDDWKNVLDGVPGNSGELLALFKPDFTGEFDDIFSGGQSVDGNDIDQWKWVESQNVQDKDDISHAFAAAYDVDGELYVYFGADRLSTSGDASLGFWFFQDEVTANELPAGTNPQGDFDGVHVIGDVLIQMDFRGGGTIPEIVAYEWVGIVIGTFPNPILSL